MHFYLNMVVFPGFEPELFAYETNGLPLPQKTKIDEMVQDSGLEPETQF